MDLREMLKNDEGLKLKPYRDDVGKLTVGYGHNLDDKGISQAAAEFLLNEDISDAIHFAKTYPWFDALDPVRQDIIVMMSFNLGPKLSQFVKFIQALKDQDFYLASKEMLDSHWARQVKDRAIRLSKMMISGKYPDANIAHNEGGGE